MPLMDVYACFVASRNEVYFYFLAATRALISTHIGIKRRQQLTMPKNRHRCFRNESLSSPESQRRYWALELYMKKLDSQAHVSRR